MRPMVVVNTTNDTNRGSAIWCDSSDVDSSARNSAVYDDACSYSDSEGTAASGGFSSPFRNKIRGLLGSFGKGKKKLLVKSASSPKKQRYHTSLSMTASYGSGESANGGFSSGRGGSLSIGQFTELVKSLPAHSFAGSAGRDSPVANSEGPNATEPTVSETLPQTSGSSSLFPASPSSFLRPRNRSSVRAGTTTGQKTTICHNNSNDTCSSMSTSQSFNTTSSSNRNSVISNAASVSSESFDNDNQSSVSENGDGGGTTSNSSPTNNNNNDNHAEEDNNMMPPSVGGGTNSSQQQQADNNTKKLFYIAREIMTSERVYVDVLRLLNIEFREYVQRARAESRSGLLPDADFVKLFSNLPELMMLNEDLLRDFEERVANWSVLPKIADVIVRKGPYLKLYTVYIRDFSAMNFHFEEVCSRYPKFGRLVREFEKLPRCQHLRLQHYMLKPVQRLPQYRLLLEDYLRHLDPHSPDFDDTAQALRIVSEAAEHANNTVKQGVSSFSYNNLQSVSAALCSSSPSPLLSISYSPFSSFPPLSPPHSFPCPILFLFSLFLPFHICLFQFITFLLALLLLS